MCDSKQNLRVEETEDSIISDGGRISFTSKFMHLGSILNFLLDEAEDAKNI